MICYEGFLYRLGLIETLSVDDNRVVVMNSDYIDVRINDAEIRHGNNSYHVIQRIYRSGDIGHFDYKPVVRLGVEFL